MVVWHEHQTYRNYQSNRLRDAAHACRQEADLQRLDRDNGYGAIVIGTGYESQPLGDSNFAAVEKMMRECRDDASRYLVINHSCGNYGDYSYVLFPLTAEWLGTAADIRDALADYALLDEDDYYEREHAILLEDIERDYVPSWIEDTDVKALLVDKMARRVSHDCGTSRIEDIPYRERDELFAQWAREIVGVDPERVDTLQRELTNFGIPVDREGWLPYLETGDTSRLSEKLGCNVLATFAGADIEGMVTEPTQWLKVYRSNLW